MIEEQIKVALEQLQSAISSGDAGGIRSNMATLEEALATKHSGIDAQLKHFLKNRSYMKALAYLNHETDIPKGKCGGRTDFT